MRLSLRLGTALDAGVAGLKNYGLDADASRLVYRWLYCIAKNAHDFNGAIPEKYDVVTGSHDVFVEYGNVGTKLSYIAERFRLDECLVRGRFGFSFAAATERFARPEITGPEMNVIQLENRRT